METKVHFVNTHSTIRLNRSFVSPSAISNDVAPNERKDWQRVKLHRGARSVECFHICHARRGRLQGDAQTTLYSERDVGMCVFRPAVTWGSEGGGSWDVSPCSLVEKHAVSIFSGWLEVMGQSGFLDEQSDVTSPYKELYQGFMSQDVAARISAGLVAGP
jgi:hypothetical protein